MALEKVSNTGRPKYQVLELCYLNEKLYDPNTMPYEEQVGGDSGEEGDEGPAPQRKPMFVYFDGEPAWYLRPVNDAAKKRVEEAIKKGRLGVKEQVDPIQALNVLPVRSTI